MESRNIHDEKRFGPTKYSPEKNLDPRKTHKKKYWTHKTPMRKKFAHTKYPRQKITDQLNTHEKRFWTHVGTGGTMTRDPRDPRLNKTHKIQHTPRKATTSSSITARLLKSTKKNCFEILKTIFSKSRTTKLIKTSKRHSNI